MCVVACISVVWLSGVKIYGGKRQATWCVDCSLSVVCVREREGEGEREKDSSQLSSRRFFSLCLQRTQNRRMHVLLDTASGGVLATAVVMLSLISTPALVNWCYHLHWAVHCTAFKLFFSNGTSQLQLRIDQNTVTAEQSKLNVDGAWKTALNKADLGAKTQCTVKTGLWIFFFFFKIGWSLAA